MLILNQLCWVLNSGQYHPAPWRHRAAALTVMINNDYTNDSHNPLTNSEHHPGSGSSPASPGMCHSPTSFQTPSEFSQKVHSGPVMVSLDLCNPAGTQGAFQDTWEGNHEHRLIHYQPVTTSLDSHYPPVLQRDVTKVRPVFPHRIS